MFEDIITDSSIAYERYKYLIETPAEDIIEDFEFEDVVILPEAIIGTF